MRWDWQAARPLMTPPAISSLAVPVFVQGLALSLGLIVAIGAQNAFVLRQGLRGEHVLLTVSVSALCDMLLITLGIAGLGSLFDGDYYVVRVRHTYNLADGYRTEFDVERPGLGPAER